jgi:hypothetical protein
VGGDDSAEVCKQNWRGEEKGKARQLAKGDGFRSARWQNGDK